MSNVTYTRKLGLNRGKARLWLEGAILLNHGFTHKAEWGMNHQPDGSIDLIIGLIGSRLVAGTPERPIIDVNSKVALQTLKGPEVTITVIGWGHLRVSNKVEA